MDLNSFAYLNPSSFVTGTALHRGEGEGGAVALSQIHAAKSSLLRHFIFYNKYMNNKHYL